MISAGRAGRLVCRSSRPIPTKPKNSKKNQKHAPPVDDGAGDVERRVVDGPADAVVGGEEHVEVPGQGVEELREEEDAEYLHEDELDGGVLLYFDGGVWGRW